MNNYQEKLESLYTKDFQLLKDLLRVVRLLVKNNPNINLSNDDTEILENTHKHISDILERDWD